MAIKNLLAKTAAVASMAACGLVAVGALTVLTVAVLNPVAVIAGVVAFFVPMALGFGAYQWFALITDSDDE